MTRPAKILPFRRPVEGLTPSDRVLLRLVDDAEQRIEPIRPTAAERKLHQQRARHYTDLERQHRREQRLERMVAFFRTDRADRLVDLICIGLIAWAIAMFAAAFVGSAL